MTFTGCNDKKSKDIYFFHLAQNVLHFEVSNISFRVNNSKRDVAVKLCVNDRLEQFICMGIKFFVNASSADTKNFLLP